jgi:hypothetical protein
MSRLWIPLLLLITLNWSTSRLCGDEKQVGSSAAFATTIEDFRELSRDEQHSLVVKAMKHRLEHGKNIYIVSRRTLRNHFYDDGVLGGVQYQGITAVNRLWRLGNSYRLDTENYGKVRPAEATNLLRRQVTGFDSVSEHSVSTRQTVGNRRSYARVAIGHNLMTEHHRYGYWLDGEHSRFAENLFRYLVDHSASLVVTTPGKEEGLVRVDVEWQPSFSHEPLGTRQFYLDPQKGFFPVRGYGKWEMLLKDGTLSWSWRQEEFRVEESRLVGDVWMPIKLQEITRGSTSPAPNIVAVYETEVLDIEQGTVTDDDLLVPLSKGMEVVDTIRSVSYVLDADTTAANGRIAVAKD